MMTTMRTKTTTKQKGEETKVMSSAPPDVPCTERDLYGQGHPIESAELIAAKLKAFEEEVAKISDEEKPCLLKAEEKCPELLNDAFKLMFLRCEVFNADLAAKRYCHYWVQRVVVFGEERAFEPLTVDKALRDDEVALAQGFMNFTGKVDPTGRSILFVDPSKQDPTAYEAKSMCRAFWYVLHSMLEDEETQKKGIVAVVWPHHVSLKQMDKKLMKLNTDSLRNCIPVRVSAFHICHPPRIFSVVFPILKFFMGEILKKRIRVHSGSKEKVLKILEEVGLTKDLVPSQLGGDVAIDAKKWIQERREAGL
ncbi:unnamed protein product [Cylindrotheca closterium]|uniref:CRAL-TRIO domain-containing protein n=1 Tax=Cylindrotheca closterium TaxID=2856 RepID=A0AAD2FII7_9STRA|nr:unnamed protein product [Cylindrotheca closterium]